MQENKTGTLCTGSCATASVQFKRYRLKKERMGKKGKYQKGAKDLESCVAIKTFPMSSRDRGGQMDVMIIWWREGGGGGLDWQAGGEEDSTICLLS